MESITETKIGNYCVEYINKYCHEHSCGSCIFRGDDWEACEASDLQSKTFDEVVNLARRIVFDEVGDNKDAIPDQTAKADAGKPDLTLVPWQIVWDIAEVRMYGVRKYVDPDNWKRVELQRYKAALMRHLLKYLDDPDSVDEESGIEHWKHAACNMSFICELEHKRQRNECKRENGEIQR